MESATRIVDSYDPDIVDINCGCWVKNVVGNGAGAGLLRDLPRMERIVSAVVKATPRPVTVKTRLGWDSESIQIVDVAKMLEQSGVKLLTIHCRTRSQGHKGVPDFTWIPKVKAAVSIPIFINGSLTSPKQIHNAFLETGCDGVMVARGAIDNPWIFKQAKEFRSSGKYEESVSLEERFLTMLRHLRLSVKHKGEKTGVIEFRKHYAGYLRGLPNSSKFRAAVMNLFQYDLAEELALAFLQELTVGNISKYISSQNLARNIEFVG
jgi:tRNA-dihydrouridine synthase B